MSAADDKLRTAHNRLLKEIAELEASLGDQRSKLAQIEAKLTGSPPPKTGLDLLWDAALPKARERSSKHECRIQWSRIPHAERPTISQAVSALQIWNKSDGWKSEGGLYCPGLDKFIKRRQWECLPESAAPLSRYRPPPPKPAAVHQPEDLITDRLEIARLLSINPLKP